MTPTASIVWILAVVSGRSIQMAQGGRWKGDGGSGSVSARDDFSETPSSLSADSAFDHFVIGGEKIQPAADTLFTRIYNLPLLRCLRRCLG